MGSHLIIRALARAGADVIGVNCAEGPEQALDIIREMRDALEGFPLMAQPNAGLPIMEGGGIVYPLGPEEMADGMSRLIEEGVNVIGGCCGTTPEHIRLMADLLPIT